MEQLIGEFNSKEDVVELASEIVKEITGENHIDFCQENGIEYEKSKLVMLNDICEKLGLKLKLLIEYDKCT